MEASIKKKKEVDLTNGNLFKKIIIVALPLMFSGCTVQAPVSSL